MAESLDHFIFDISHGVDGFPEKSWYAWLADKLKRLGHTVYVSQKPTLVPRSGIKKYLRNNPGKPFPQDCLSYEKQTLEEWLNVFRRDLDGKERKRIILIGHSLGALAVLRAAEKLTDQYNPFHAVVAVSPVVGYMPNLLECYPGLGSFHENINWTAVRANITNLVTVSSENDQVIPHGQLEWLEKKCGGVDLSITVNEGDHLNYLSGYGPFPALFAIAKALTCQEGKITPEHLRQYLPKEWRDPAEPNRLVVPKKWHVPGIL